MAEKRNAEVRSIKIDKIRLLEVDKAMKEWLSNSNATVINGKKVPVIFGAWERFVQMQGMKDDDSLNSIRDKSGMIKLPLISIMRTGVSPVVERSVYTTAEGSPYITFRKEIAQAKFDKRRVPFQNKWDTGLKVYKSTAPVYEVHKIPYPEFVQIDYRVIFWCSYIKHANLFHNTIWTTRKQDNISYNGYNFFMEIIDSSDESNMEDFSTEERIIKHGFNIKVEAYLIDKDEIIVNRTVSKLVLSENLFEISNDFSLKDMTAEDFKDLVSEETTKQNFTSSINPKLSNTVVYETRGLTATALSTNSLTSDFIISNNSTFSSLTAGTVTTNSAIFTGDYLHPIIIGDRRLWFDTINDVLRVKKGSNPTSEIDGNKLNELKET